MQQLSLLSPTVQGPEPPPENGLAAPGARQPKQLMVWLAQQLGQPVELVFTNNRSTMLSMREQGGVVFLRLHRAFLDAPEVVWLALAAYLGDDDARAGALLDEFVTSITAQVHSLPVKLQPVGRFHHLQEIFDHLNGRFFHDGCGARITWGRAGGRRYRRSIQLGSFVASENLIRIHPNLDQLFVPRYYVEWVVFHEMLHEVYGAERRGGRRIVHPPEFAALEESFPNFRRCKHWEQQNIHRLLR